jgi:hypothetical protein
LSAGQRHVLLNGFFSINMTDDVSFGGDWQEAVNTSFTNVLDVDEILGDI